MKKIIYWMTDNHVTTNLMMILILLIGGISMISLKTEIFPEIDMDKVSVLVKYRGASPDEIEKNIIIKIEEAISAVDGIKEFSSLAAEGAGSLTININQDEDANEVKDLIQSEIERITSFPEDAERPEIKLLTRKMPVIQLVLSGAVEEKILTTLGEKVKDELLQLESITQVGLSGFKNYEISVEVPETKLREYNLNFDKIALAIKTGSMDLPGGKVTTKNGEITIRTKALGITKEDYENLIISTDKAGNKILVKDVAKVTDGFEESDLISYFDSNPAKSLTIYRVGDQDPRKVAQSVKNYINNNQHKLPKGVSMSFWRDDSKLLKERLELLVKNGILGLILVIISLSLFLEVRLALWVSMGIVISFMGSFAIMSILGISINMISLFAFILVLGIVVDDAIVVGENIFTHRGPGIHPNKAAKIGASRVAAPVVFAVLTTVAAFAPMLFTKGMMGKMMFQVPAIVISVLTFSLIESLFILPAHLSSLKEKPSKLIKAIDIISVKVDKLLALFLKKAYRPLIKKLLRNRYLTISMAISLLVISLGMVKAGIIKFNFMPQIESDNIVVKLSMPVGTTISTTEQILRKIEKNALTIEKQYMQKNGNKKIFKHIYTIIGEQPSTKMGPQGSTNPLADPTIAEINIELISADSRNFSTTEVLNKWRDLTGEIPAIKTLIFTSSLLSVGDPISLQLSANNSKELIECSEYLKNILKEYNGILNIKDDFAEGKYELKLKLKPAAASLGLTLADLAKQTRQGFYGEEALRIQRDDNEVKIMIRYPKKERSSLANIENMMIRTRTGIEVPFSEVAEVNFGRGYSRINRQDRNRIITVSADIDEAILNSDEINGVIKSRFETEVKAKFPNTYFVKAGSQKEQQESMQSLGKGFIIAIFIIYILLAIPFKSYMQPLIIMSAIPFGIIGAVIGHFLMGYELSVMSAMGIVALSGVVVNDSLVFVDYVNKHRDKEKTNMFDAVVMAGMKRFRPIMLTSITTFLGLMPMIFETSLQAKFLIPMAISLGFGIIFATGITLIFIPSGLLILEDFKTLFKGGKSE